LGHGGVAQVVATGHAEQIEGTLDVVAEDGRLEQQPDVLHLDVARLVVVLLQAVPHRVGRRLVPAAAAAVEEDDAVRRRSDVCQPLDRRHPEAPLPVGIRLRERHVVIVPWGSEGAPLRVCREEVRGLSEGAVWKDDAEALLVPPVRHRREALCVAQRHNA